MGAPWGALTTLRAVCAQNAPSPIPSREQDARSGCTQAEVETDQGLLRGGESFLGWGTPHPRPGRRINRLLRAAPSWAWGMQEGDEAVQALGAQRGLEG